jgi:dTDP-4-amino-4,6-dideoxygalactose transaminase
MIPLATPDLGELEAAAVMEALSSGFVSSVGPAVDAFEAAFAEAVGSTYAVACASGTAAIHLALDALGVGRDDEVFCSDFTFVGSVNPIAYQGAQPVFVDSEPTTWNLDASLVVAELDRRATAGESMPKAIEVVHVLGMPADLEALLAAAAKHGIAVIEDAAESLGAGWSSGPFAGRMTGSVGTIGCFSFNGNKIATAGGGGMIVTDDKELAVRARHLSTQAKVPDIGYLHDTVGYNYRLTNLAAALGGAQLARLPEFVAAKRRIASAYDAAFAGLPLTLPPRVEGYDATYWLYSVLTRDLAERDALLEHLATSGVGARALWRPLHQQPPFASYPTIGKTVSVSLFERGLSLPCSTHLSDVDQARVIEAVRAFY